MWRQSALFLLYLMVVVSLTWLLELSFWWETGYTSFHLMNSLRNLSVSQIRILLDLRGVKYTAILEKQDIVTLLQQSGPMQYGELYSKKPQGSAPIEITKKEDFFEQVYEEDEKVWIVEVVPGEGQYAGHRLLDDLAWHSLTPHLTALHITPAVLSCHHDPRFCALQGWSHPQLLLILPPVQYTSPNKLTHTNLHTHNYRRISSREHIPLSSTTHLSAAMVLSWMSKEILSRIPTIQDINSLEKVWLNSTYVNEDKVPHMVFISELVNPPLLLATLGLRLSSRIKLASIAVKKEEKDQVNRILKKSGLGEIPSLAVITGEGKTSYGFKKGEPLTHSALNFYICSLQPKMNDAFVVSLMIANLLAFADFIYFIDTRIRAWKYLLATLIRVVVYNVSVFLLWLALTALLKFPLAHKVLQSGNWLISRFNSSWFFSQVRYHWLVLEGNAALFWLSVIVFGVFVFIWQKQRRREATEDEELEWTWWGLIPLDSYLVNVLFRPMSSLSRPRPSQDLDLEEGMEQLIQRLATLDLWLHPVIPTDYMKNLPMWRYDGWGNEDDLKSESETDMDSVSENENEILGSHTCCQDEHCRLCEMWTTVKEIYVCHRCAILKRKLERRYMRYRDTEELELQTATYERLIKVCENCCKSRKGQNSTCTTKEVKSKRSSWLLSPQTLTELKWSAPVHAIESRVCVICLVKYRWSAVLCGLPCGHNYHHSCITEWLLKDNHHCPTCRWPSYKTKTDMITMHPHEE